MVCILCVQMMASAIGAGSGKTLGPGCLCLNPDDQSDTEAARYSQPRQSPALKSHLDPQSDHLTWETTKSGEIQVKRFDENRLATILKDFTAAFKSSILGDSASFPGYCCFSGQTWNWAYQRAVEMKSDSDHVLRAVHVEQNIVKTGGKNVAAKNTNATATSGSYWADYEMWQKRVLNGKAMNAETNRGNPSSWDLIHLAVATGGLGVSRVPLDFVRSKFGNAAAEDDSETASSTVPLNFFQLVDLTSRTWKEEKSVLEGEVQSLSSDNNNKNNNNNESKQRLRQDLFTKDRILRAVQAKILAAKCLASRKSDYPAVIEDFCEPAKRIDPQASREAAFIFLSKGYEANIEHRKKLLQLEAKKNQTTTSDDDKNKNINNKDGSKVEDVGGDARLKLKWYMFYDEVAAPIVMFPCSTCSSPCMSAPQCRLPWGGSVSVGELRQKLDSLAPGFVDILQKYNVPMECETVKSKYPEGTAPALPENL